MHSKFIRFSYFSFAPSPQYQNPDFAFQSSKNVLSCWGLRHLVSTLFSTCPQSKSTQLVFTAYLVLYLFARNSSFVAFLSYDFHVLGIGFPLSLSLSLSLSLRVYLSILFSRLVFLWGEGALCISVM
ncbi:hypothetical protein ACMFMG_010089 [Clarireedia jacksonii]